MSDEKGFNDHRERLADFIGVGVKLIYESFDEIRSNKALPPSSLRGKLISPAADGLAYLTGLKIIKSGVEEMWKIFETCKHEKQQKNMLMRTHSSGDNEKAFLLSIAEGLSYVCIAYEAQLKNIVSNDWNERVFFLDVFTRVFSYLQEGHHSREQMFDGQTFYNAFVNGKSTPIDTFEKLITTGSLRGEKLDSGENIRNFFEKTGLIIPKGDATYELMIAKSNFVDINKLEIKDFRFTYSFEKNEKINRFRKIRLPKLDRILKEDWRMCESNVKEYAQDIIKKLVLPNSIIIRELPKHLDQMKSDIFNKIDQVMLGCSSDRRQSLIRPGITPERNSSREMKPEQWNFNNNSKWWPDEKTLPNSFYKRKCGNELLTDKLRSLLLENENGKTVSTKQMVLSGLGGIGKSTAAKWFAKEYENEYDHIIWIDAEAGSLCTSFQKLARDLELKNRKELDLKELATKSYNILQQSTCLLIFDNAVSYFGQDGIQSVLPPKTCTGFHVIITSIKRKWGNSTGDGEIPEFHLHGFTQNEGLEFMKTNLKYVSTVNETKLRSLCDLLGNFPLALQMAVATLNRQKISNLQNYMEKIKNNSEVVNAQLDDYEKTIDTTMKLSFDLIQNEEENIGQVAMTVLTIFGFIKPDNVHSDFFIAVTNTKKTCFTKLKCSFRNTNNNGRRHIIHEGDLEKATDLLGSYSLVKKNVLSDGTFTLTIHRLLQQVIRHNWKAKRKEIVGHILNCKGFLEYKLIPFSHAGTKLQKKFPKIKTELIDILELNKLLKERRFKEAVELSRLIKDSVKISKKLSNYYSLETATDIFNYAVCLKHNLEISEAKAVLENLHSKVVREKLFFYFNYFTQWGTIDDTNQVLTREVTSAQLFLIYSIQNNEEKAKNIILESKQAIFPISCIRDILNYLNALSFRQFSLNYDASNKYISLTLDTRLEKSDISLKSDVVAKQVFIASCSVDEKLKFPPETQLTFDNVDFFNGLKPSGISCLTITNSEIVLSNNGMFNRLSATTMRLKNVAITTIEQDTHKILSKIFDFEKIRNFEMDNVFLIVKSNETGEEIFIEDHEFLKSLIESLSSIIHYILICKDLRYISLSLKDDNKGKRIHLDQCSFDKDFELRFSLEELTLTAVETSLRLSQFVQLQQIEKLILNDMTVDFSENISANEIHLARVNVENWATAQYTIKKLELYKMNFIEKTQMTISKMKIIGYSVDISVLPSSLVKLELQGCNLINCYQSSLKNLQLPNLRALQLLRIKVEGKVTEKFKNFDISSLILPTIRELRVLCFNYNNPPTRLSCSLDCIKFVKDLHLDSCDLIINSSAIHIPFKQLTLKHVNIMNEEKQEISYMCLNDFTNLQEMESLNISNIKAGISLNLGENLFIKNVHLDKVQISNLRSAKWTVAEFSLKEISFLEKSQLSVTELTITNSFVDIATLPPSLNKLKLEQCTVINCSDIQDVRKLPPNLKELSLIGIQIQDKKQRKISIFDMSPFITPKIEKIQVNSEGVNLKSSSCLHFSLQSLKKVQNVKLCKCEIILSPGLQISPKELSFMNVTVFDDHHLKPIPVNNFLDLRRMERLHLKYEYCRPLSIDFSESVTMKDLTLKNVNIFNWKHGKWNIDQLHVSPDPGPTQMKIKTFNRR